MIMKDFVTPEERLELNILECVGCGRTVLEVLNEACCSLHELEEYALTTDSGHWYCHSDCYRDSR